jgi:Na+-transporting NADH:ubiquinone oxidoreductase subunit C
MSNGDKSDIRVGSSSSWLKMLLDMPNDSAAKAIVVTLIVSLVASVLVAGSAVLLRPAQIANKQLEQKKRILEILEGVSIVGERLGSVDVKDLDARVVDLASGEYAATLDADEYDQRQAAKDPAQSVAILPEKDIAQIGRRAKFALVYEFTKAGRLELIVLPVHGRGFGSTLYGYLGLAGDMQTIVGLSFYEQGETPGLGALIDDPDWRKQWSGKKVWDKSGNVRLGVARGDVLPGAANAPYEVDGLTGATWTSRGVTNLLRYWLGEGGFSPYLRKIMKERR